MLGLVGPTATVATNAGKAIGLLRSLKDVSEEGELLWHALDSMETPLQLAICYQKRHVTLPFFHSAVRLANCVIESCERLLARDDGEDGRPSSQEGWLEWLDHKKDSVRRRDALPKVTSRIAVSMNSLQLAFAAMSTVHPPVGLRHRSASMSKSWEAEIHAPFEFLSAARESARQLVHEFEMGRRRRVLCSAARLFQATLCSGETSPKARKTVRDVGAHTMWIELDENSKYMFCFRRAPKSRLDEDDTESEDDEGDSKGGGYSSSGQAARTVYPSDMKVRARFPVCQERWKVGRTRPSELKKSLDLDDDMMFGGEQIMYEIGAADQVFLTFFEVPCTSALLSSKDDYEATHQPMSVEMFEAFIVMLGLKDGLEDAEHLLANAETRDGKKLDLDSIEGLAILFEWLEQIGVYEEPEKGSALRAELESLRDAERRNNSMLGRRVSRPSSPNSVVVEPRPSQK